MPGQWSNLEKAGNFPSLSLPPPMPDDVIMHHMDGRKIHFRKFEREAPTVAVVLKDKTLVELVYDPFDKRTSFAVSKDGRWRIEQSVMSKGGERLVPYRADNNLIKHNVVLFPSEPEDYSTTAELLADIRDYIHRYVALSEHFETLVAHYALFTWVHDRFNELPYLRLKGEFGTGKTRFLITVGSICRTPIFASGASSVSPLFHLLDRFGGTLLLDEADFRFSDAAADIAKILNNGNVKGFPVLRSESKDGKEFNPRAFQVFGPKLVAMRGHFDDTALESRFLTETSGGQPLRRDVPINLPEEQKWEALRLRNKLLAFRFRNYFRFDGAAPFLDPGFEARLNQILSPLAAVIDDTDARDALATFAKDAHDALQAERDGSLEAQVLTVIRLLSETASVIGIPIKKVTALYNRTYGKEFGCTATPKWMGGIIRKRLNLKTHKSHGIFVVGPAEQAKLTLLYERYGVTDEDVDVLANTPGALTGELHLERSQAGDFRDMGDIPTLPTIQ
ncbi:hypothetical protein JDN40_14915 [Rhodomicrobium vannielii ATCC 17100]|uniref:hypothetical protein n=1 Tax=Rhodomicrobium vannielii TaxID=1069 RepID=UPI00191AC8D9|nr:hypothetical protein [Rhodomicrobium vannielii]MBJ7535399.1 hypothetical protein [Rhodomicrobium vannielii ATCC 17100]